MQASCSLEPPAETSKCEARDSQCRAQVLQFKVSAGKCELADLHFLPRELQIRSQNRQCGACDQIALTPAYERASYSIKAATKLKIATA